ncbi:MAG: acyl-CoA dehydrogenase, partial [Actinomycetota bacterium]
MEVTEAELREEVRAWFDAAWDPDLSLLVWRRRLVEAGWAVPSWEPRWSGRGLPAWSDRVAHRTIREAGGVAVPLG